MEFNKASFDLFRKDCTEALRAVGEKHDIAIELGSINYGSDTFNVKMECKKTDAGDVNQKEFLRHCEIYGFKPEDYHREFALNSKTFKLTGFNHRSPKNCCEIVDVISGDKYKANAETVLRALAFAGEKAGV